MSGYLAIESTEMRHGKPVIRYFVSYAHADKDLKDELLKPLKQHLAIAKDYCFEAWDDSEILAGERWHERIQAAIAHCQFGLLLVTPAFLGSTYIQDHELRAFVASNLADPEPGKRAIPVALKSILFDDSIDLKGLERLQVFRNSAGRAFDACVNARTRNNFALELFQQILKIVQRHGAHGAPPHPSESEPRGIGRNDDHGLRSAKPGSKERLPDQEQQITKALGPPLNPYQLRQGLPITLASLASTLSEIGRISGSLDILVIFGSGRRGTSSKRIGLVTDALYLPEIVHDLSEISHRDGIHLAFQSVLDIDVLKNDSAPISLLTSHNIISIGTGDVNGVTAAIFTAFKHKGLKSKLAAWFDGYYDIFSQHKSLSDISIVKHRNEPGLGMLFESVNPWNDTRICLVAGGSRTLGTTGALYVLHRYLRSYFDPAHSLDKISRMAMTSPARIIFEAAPKQYDPKYYGSIRDAAELTPQEDLRNINENLEHWIFHE